MIVNCCGMYRSGSTLTYMICQKLIDYNSLNGSLFVDKRHHTIIPDSNSIYSYRDVRDVIASFIQKYKFSFNDFKIEEKKVFEFIDWIIEFDNKIRISSTNKLILRYESFVDDLPSLINEISMFLNLKPDFNEKISQEVSFDKLHALTNNPSFKKDWKTQLWPRHLKDGKIKKYKEILTESQLQQIYQKTKAKNWLEENKYE